MSLVISQSFSISVEDFDLSCFMYLCIRSRVSMVQPFRIFLKSIDGSLVLASALVNAVKNLTWSSDTVLSKVLLFTRCF